MNGKTAYRLTECGTVIVVDRRHLTNGAIVPNYVVDLYLPILGYEGLGVLTMLYRFVNRGKHQLRLDLHKHARVGRIGFRTLAQRLDLLVECRIIDVTKPQGLDRRFHRRTVIDLLDPPIEVPAKWAEEVVQRTPAEWLFEQEVSDSTSIEVSPNTSIEVPSSTLIEVTPSTSIKVPIETLIEMSAGTSIKVPSSTSMLDVPTEDVPTGDAAAAAVAPTVQFLSEQGVIAADEFGRLDLAAVQARVAKIQRNPDWRPSDITTSLRRHPPKEAALSAESQRPSLASSDEAARRAREIAPDATEEELARLIIELVEGASEDQALDWLANHRAFQAHWAQRGAMP